MALQVPNLDSRTFEQLLAEARRRISRYAPEWTDHNPSDPGMTLVELFAWLTEITLFELNRVPDLTYVKFLELLGLRQSPAAPAVAELTFTPAPQTTDAVVPARTQVSAPAPSGPPLVFETDQALALVLHPLEAVVVHDGATFTTVTGSNTVTATGSGASYRPLGWIPQPGNALYLGFTPPAAREGEPPVPGRFPAHIRLRVTLPSAASAGTPQRAGPAVHVADPPVRLVWEYRPEEHSPNWRQLGVYADDSGAFTREGYLTLAGPEQIRPTRAANIPEPRYWIRARLAHGTYPAGHEPQVDAVTVNTTTARHLATVTEELLGVSDGSPEQVFTTRHTPVAADTLRLTVRETAREADEAEEAGGEEGQRWTEVADFLASGPEDRHYTLDGDTGEVTFGDGARGLIPAADAEVVAVEYRYGGGDAGNVPAGTLKDPLAALPGVGEVTNHRGSAGGSRRQSLEALKRDAPALLRHQQRAVTADDYATLARQTGGVADAHALPLTHPDHPGVQVPGAVTVVVVADREEERPAPDGDLIAGVCRYLEPYRLIATELYVRGPVFVPVAVHATVTADPYAAADAVAVDVETALRQWLAPLDHAPDGTRSARFRDRFWPTELYGVVLSAPGAVAVTALEVTCDGQPVDDLRQPVDLPPGALLTSAPHRIDVQPGGSYATEGR